MTTLPLIGLFRVDLDRRQLQSRFAAGEAYYLPPPAVIRALSFGYNELVADLLWVRTIAYFAEHLTSDRDLTHLARHLDNILALDGHFRAVYRYGAAMLMTEGSNRTTLDAIKLLKHGHERFPDDWQIAFNIGSYYMWELRTKSEAEKAEWTRQGAEWIRRAALLGAHIPWLPSLAAQLFTEQGQRGLAIRHLEELYLTTQDNEMKKQIAAKLRTLKARHKRDSSSA